MTKSRRSRSSRTGSRSSTSGIRCATAPSQKIRPITAARWSSRFSSRGSRSMRAAIIAWSVSGIRFDERAALEQHPHRLLDEERVALGLLEQRPSRSVGGSSRSASSASTSSSLSSGASGSSSIAVGADAPAAPARPHVEQLRPREAEDQQRRVLDALGEVLDQLEQRLLGPVDVLEDEDERLRVGELGGPLARRPGDLLLAALGLDRLEHADGEREQVGDRVVAALGAQLRDRLLDRVVVRDPGRDLDHLGERPVGDALAVGKRAAGEDARALDARRGTRARAGSSRPRARRRS